MICTKPVSCLVWQEALQHFELQQYAAAETQGAATAAAQDVLYAAQAYVATSAPGYAPHQMEQGTEQQVPRHLHRNTLLQYTQSRA